MNSSWNHATSFRLCSFDQTKKRKNEAKIAAKLRQTKLRISAENSFAMNTFQVFTHAWLIVILASLLNLTKGKRYATIIRSAGGDYFTNPAENCDPGSCYRYNSTVVGGYCVSSGECCIQCRCERHAMTFVAPAKRCMSLEQIQQFKINQTPDGK